MRLDRTLSFIGYRFLGAFFALIAFLSGCQEEGIQSRVVAQIGSKKISVTDLALRLLQTPGLKDASEGTRMKSAKVILDSLIDDHVFFLEAKKHGIAVSDAEVEHHFRYQKAVLGQVDLFRFQKESLIDDVRIKEQYREQLTIAAFVTSMQERGQVFCEAVLEKPISKGCTKKEDFLLTLRKKYRIDVNAMNIPLAIKVLGEHA